MTLMNHIIDRCFTLLNNKIKEMDERFEELKRELFDWGSDYIEEFLGFEEVVNYYIYFAKN